MAILFIHQPHKFRKQFFKPPLFRNPVFGVTHYPRCNPGLTDCTANASMALCGMGEYAHGLPFQNLKICVTATSADMMIAPIDNARSGLPLIVSISLAF